MGGFFLLEAATEFACNEGESNGNFLSSLFLPPPANLFGNATLSMSLFEKVPNFGMLKSCFKTFRERT